MSPSPNSRGFFPAPWRAHAWTRTAAPFDVIVVGGGITGAGIARDASLRGLRVGLFDKSDFGSGTSSRSSRMVHGGVRYLEHGHLHLVLESSRERRTLLRIAPHLVRPLAFTWPVYAGARVPLWKLRLGLTLYDVLALYRNVARSRRLAPDDVRRGEPQLLDQRLLGGARYYDAATDDARLVLANVVAAHEQGAVVLNYAIVERVHARGNPNALCAVEIRDVVTGVVQRLQSRAVVFAVGPWSDQVPALIGQDTPEARVVPSLGAHIALERRRVGNVGAVTLVAPSDGRVFFVVPANDLTIATTTETPAHSPDNPRASRADVQYLLAAVNHYFPATNATPADVVAAWAGVRPLAVPNAKDLTSASREHTIAEPVPGVYLVTGGKLTTFRAMAEEVVDRLARALLPRFRRAVTQFVPLPGGELTDLRVAIAHACEAVHDPGLAERLVYAYGARWPFVWKGHNEGPSEALYAVEREFAVTLADVLFRRVPIAFEEADHGIGAAARLATTFASRFGWDARAVDEALRAYQEAVARQFNIDEGAAPNVRGATSRA